jgi:hypothetical protein
LRGIKALLAVHEALLRELTMLYAMGFLWLFTIA